jgi:peptidyl-prolyl cis-trans isomerase C
VLVFKKTAVFMLLLALGAIACSKSADKASAPAAGTATTPASGPSQAVAPASGTPPPAGQAVPAPPTAKPVPAQLPDVVARVNGEDVKKTELEMAIRSLEDRARSPVPAEQRDAVYRQVLDRLIGFHLLVQESKARKVLAPPWEVDGQVDQIKKQFPSEDAFKQMLQSRGVTIEQLRSDTAQTIAVNLMLKNELEPKVAVTEADSKKFFDENKPRFRQEDSVHASHILIRTPENADAATKAKARAQADDLLAQIKKGGDFGELAKKYSQDPGSAPKGGDLGFFSKGQMVPAFEQAAFGLKPGQTSGVVETPFGFHIIRVSEAKAGRDLTYDEVKGQIDDYLKQQLREKKSQEFVDQLKAKGKVQIFI